MWGIFALFRIKWRNFTNIFYKYFCHTGCSAVLVIQLYIVTFVAHWAQCSLFSSHTHFHNQHTAQKKRVSMPRSRGAASVELSTRLCEIYHTWRRLLSNRTFSSFKVPSCGFTVKNLWRHHAICHLGNGQLSICIIYTGCCKTTGKLWQHITETLYGVFLLFLCSFDCQIWAIFHFGTLWL